MLVESGLVGLRLPERSGGGATSAVEVAIVAEALGKHVAATPFVGPVLAADLLASASAADDLLEKVATGQRRLTIALDPALSGLGRLHGGGSGGGPSGSGGGPSGSGGGSGGDEVIGWDALGAGELVGLVGGAGEPARVGLLPANGAALSSSDLTRACVAVPAGRPVVVGLPLGDEARQRWEALGLVLLCADMVGAMAGSLARAVEYAKERVQFKRPIGSFQAIAHLAADQYVSTEASRSATYYAAWAVDGLTAADALAAARVAKAYVSPRAREVTEAVLQIYGGIGHTWEHAAHYFLRRVLLDRRTLGDESVQLGHLAQAVLAGEPGPTAEPETAAQAATAPGAGAPGAAAPGGAHSHS